MLDDDIEVEPEMLKVKDQEGNVVLKPKPPEEIPLEDLYNVNYFQLRIDEIKPQKVLVPSGAEDARGEIEVTDEETEPFQQPKIVIGVCRASF